MQIDHGIIFGLIIFGIGGSPLEPLLEIVISIVNDATTCKIVADGADMWGPGKSREEGELKKCGILYNVL